MRTFILGDVHGAYRALQCVLNKVEFEYNVDKLIFIGDIADGWGEFDKCLNLFQSIGNFTAIVGNHDIFIRNYIKSGVIDKRWMMQGGVKTVEMLAKDKHLRDLFELYFANSKYYTIENNNFICHAGFNLGSMMNSIDDITFATNRSLYKTMVKADRCGEKVLFDYSLGYFNRVIIGHTPTHKHIPFISNQCINIDTGAGKFGKLTLYNLDENTYIQSKFVKSYYKKPHKKWGKKLTK